MHAQTHTGQDRTGGEAYWKMLGQSSLDIHCHWMAAGVGIPRAVHLRVGLLPYMCTSVSTATSFSIIWGGTVGEKKPEALVITHINSKYRETLSECSIVNFRAYMLIVKEAEEGHGESGVG